MNAPSATPATVKEEPHTVAVHKRNHSHLAFRSTTRPEQMHCREDEQRLSIAEEKPTHEELHLSSPTAISLYQVSPPPLDNVTQIMHIAPADPTEQLHRRGSTALGYGLAADRVYNRRVALHCLYEAQPPRQNVHRANSKFRTAAKLGCAASLVDLAVSNLFGIGVPRNPRITEALLRDATEKGSVQALEVRALCHMSGVLDGERKYAVAHQLLQLGMRRHSASCMLWEAFCYEVGLGVGADPQRAVDTYRASAVSEELMSSLPAAYPGALTAGNPWMLLKMALFFMHVSSGSPWYHCGMKCLECAASLGLPDAQLYFAKCFLHGRRNQRSVSQAIFWLHWAANASPPHQVAKALLKELYE